MANPVELAGDSYREVAASQTNSLLGEGIIEKVIVQPLTTAPGTVVLVDGATTVELYPGGTVTEALYPIEYNLGIKNSAVGQTWKISTTTNLRCIVIGKF